MNKKFTIVIGAIVFLVIFWVMMGFEGKEVPYVTVEELKSVTDFSQEIRSPKVKRFRLGGTVHEGSIIRDQANPLNVSFLLQQGESTLPVSYNKITPDMFQDGAEVIVEGIYINGEFEADNLMTKCASRYEGDLRKAEVYHPSISDTMGIRN